MPTPARPRRRLFIHSDCETGIYHVVSRVVDRRLVFGLEEKEQFVQMMRALEALCQVQILTYCIMGNHFHMLVRVPDRPEGFDMDLETLRGLWRKAVGNQRREQVDHFLDLWQTNGSGRAVEEWRERTIGSMFKLSEFMRLLKNRFSHWFNKRHSRTGTLWEGRYTSVAVEDEERALRTMATYIDLNPVRAGIVQNPADYPWCGYAEAMTGNVKAREGLERVVWRGRSGVERAAREGVGIGDTPKEGEGAGMCGAELADAGLADAERNGGSGRRDGGAPGDACAPLPAKREPSRKRQMVEALVIYRSFMGILGRELQFPDGTHKRRGLSEALAQRFRKAGAGAVRTETLLRRVRHLTRGVVFGSKQFIDDWFTANRSRVCSGSSAETRTRGSRPVGRAVLPEFHTLRGLKESPQSK